MKIQQIPNPDSPKNEAFEAIVELYYQICGYVTSSGKWFWVWEDGKQQRGYQDIDVLAIKEKQVVIVSVTSNLDDKLSKKRNGTFDEIKLRNLLGYFNRVKHYLSSVPEYKWLTSPDREIKPVVAYNHAFKKARLEVIPFLEKQGIEVISAKKMLSDLKSFIKQPNLKIQDQMLRTIQLIEYNKEI